MVAVLVLLPPSEGKTSPTSGSPVDLASLSHPELTAARAQVMAALIETSGRADAARLLGVGASLEHEVAAQSRLRSAPCAPAAQIYTGVLYDAAGASTWEGATLRRAAHRVRIVSALWGALTPADAIPAYRLAMGATLPDIGRLAPFWRAHLPAALGPLADDGLVVDCRSSDYVAPWHPRSPRHFQVRVEKDAKGRRTVVSHFAKHTRGVLAGLLATADAVPTSGDDLAHAATGLIGQGTAIATVAAVELTPGRLTLVVHSRT